VVDSNAAVRASVVETLVQFFDPHVIPCWDGTRTNPSNPKLIIPPSETSMTVFWQMSSQVLLSLARQALDFRLENQDYTSAHVLELIRKILARRNEYLRLQSQVAHMGYHIQDRYSSCVTLEVSLLVFLGSSNVDLSLMAIECLGRLVEEVGLTGEYDIQSGSISSDAIITSSIVDNASIYEELRLLVQNRPDIRTGQKVLQKAVRKILRQVKYATPGTMDAWEEVYRRWKTLNQFLTSKKGFPGTFPMGTVAPINEETVDSDGRRRIRSIASKPTSVTPNLAINNESVEDRGEWQYYCGFLCALGGICLQAGSLSHSSPTNSKPESLIRSVSRKDELSNISVEGSVSMIHRNSHIVSEQSAAFLSSYRHARTLVDRFIVDLVESMVCDNLMLREISRDFLGRELHVMLFPTLFTNLENTLCRISELSSDTFYHDRNVLFVGNAILVLKLVLERTGGGKEDYLSGEHFINIDFGTLIWSFVSYLNRLSTMPSQIAVSFRIKTLLCQLVDALIEKKDVVGLKQEIRFRNRLVETFMEWHSEISGVMEVVVDDGSYFLTGATSEKLVKELEHATLKSMVGLLVELPLQNQSDNNSGWTPEENATESRTRLFTKYLNFFLKVLSSINQVIYFSLIE
jgi:hypothetical protein